MTEADVDVLVLGGGSGGYAAALRAAQLGRTVAIIEAAEVGGTCLHRGCVPTKALLHSAEVADITRDAARSGITASFDGVDMSAVSAFRTKIVAKKHAGLSGLLSARGVRVIPGRGRLVGEGGVDVHGTVITGTDLVIAVGGTTRTIPGVTPGRRILTSDSALTLDEVPDSVVILGGGVIGVEFASIWRSFGAEVTIVEPLSRLLPSEDESSSAALARALRKRGISLELGRSAAQTEESDSGVTITLDDGRILRATHALIAAGRVPALEDLGLENAGVDTADGFIVTDDLLHTTAPRTWAVGDVVRGPQLAHRGFAHGIAVAERIAGVTVAPVPDHLVPRVAYSHPEVASVGLTETAARERFGADAVVAAEFPLAANAKSEILGTTGFVKVVRRRDGPVLGVHMVGDRVGELISEAQLLVGWDAHPEDVAPFLHAHPTQSEALGEALLMLSGTPLHAL